MSKEKQIEEMAKIIGIPCYKRIEEYGDGSQECPSPLPCNECTAELLYNAGYRKIPDKIGDFSDGYHTFNELYHHRAVLFSVICNMFPEKAWKSKLHDTGDMYEGMFIVGIETEQGQATYHYDIEPYWDMFKVKELDKALKWDGHTPSDAIERIGNLSCEGYRKQSGAQRQIPCEIGSKIYEVTGEPGERIDIDEYTVSEVGLNGVFTIGGWPCYRPHRRYFTYADEGVWWFFKREDAEAERKRRDDP